MNPHEKIKSREELKSIVSKLKVEGKKIVTVNGSFDMMHYGHIYTFNLAKQQGDILIVGVNSDKSYKIYKDIRGPMIPEKQRALSVASLEAVDYVTLFDE